jgi:hypothetical protein
LNVNCYAVDDLSLLCFDLEDSEQFVFPDLSIKLDINVTKFEDYTA